MKSINIMLILTGQERASLSTNSSSEVFPQQVTRDQQPLLASPDAQYTVHGRQTACSLPQIHQDDSRRPFIVDESISRQLTEHIDSRDLYLTGHPDFADAETFSYSLPSFNAISEIPVLPHSGFSAPQETAALPSTSFDYCIPSFSQITGIPSPEQ